jgi:tight adherence protein B
VSQDKPAGQDFRGSAGDFLGDFRSRLLTSVTFLESDEINSKLLSANWKISGTEYYIIQYGGALLVFLLGGLLLSGSFVSGIGLAILAFIAPNYLLERSIRRRSTLFENQLIDILVLINGSVRAGYSLLQSLDVVVQELPAPASEEFERVKREVGLGMPMRQALVNLTLRRKNEDLSMIVTAININSQVGGNLSQMLEAVTETVRDRINILGEVRALTSYSRFTGTLLTFLPFGVAALLFLLNPQYISQIFVPGPFLIIPIVAVIMIIIGNIWLRKLGQIDV